MPAAAAKSPITDSDRPYIGEESTTVPPESENARSTSESGARSASDEPISNVCHEPMPIIGMDSPEDGIFFATGGFDLSMATALN
jgi:hypothetical protein